MVWNAHERILEAPVEEVGRLLDRLGGPADVLWPSPAWSPMRLDRPVAVGARGGHDAARYHVSAHEPGRRVEFTFEPGQVFEGTHAFGAVPIGPGRTLLRHVAQGRIHGAMRLAWPLAVRWLHDAFLEDLLDRAGDAVGDPPARRARRSVWVRVLRRFDGDPARAVPVPRTALLDGSRPALPRVNYSDAYAVERRPGTTADPQAWADAAFRTAPAWVGALLLLRNALVGLVGIDRGGPESFATVARAPGEVLLGTDERHLDFRASVLVEADRVVLSTVVQVHGARGRAYLAVVRRVHPTVVRAMLRRAARLVSHRSVPVVRRRATRAA